MLKNFYNYCSYIMVQQFIQQHILGYLPIATKPCIMCRPQVSCQLSGMALVMAVILQASTNLCKIKLYACVVTGYTLGGCHLHNRCLGIYCTTAS